MYQFFCTVLAAVILCYLAYRVVRWMFRVDTAIEDRRKAAGHLAVALSKVGLKKIPSFLICYSVGDYSGMAMMIVELAKLFTGPGSEVAVLEEFNNVFSNLLTSKLSSEDGRAYIAARLSDASNVGDVSAIIGAPKATIK